MRTNTPELSFSSRILYTSRIVQLPSLPPVQYSRPIPPWVLIRPFSTVMEPGPTCFHPVRSLPLNSGFQFWDCADDQSTGARTKHSSHEYLIMNRPSAKKIVMRNIEAEHHDATPGRMQVLPKLGFGMPTRAGSWPIGKKSFFRSR